MAFSLEKVVSADVRSACARTTTHRGFLLLSVPRLGRPACQERPDLPPVLVQLLRELQGIFSPGLSLPLRRKQSAHRDCEAPATADARMCQREKETVGISVPKARLQNPIRRRCLRKLLAVGGTQ